MRSLHEMHKMKAYFEDSNISSALLSSGITERI